MAAPKGIPNKTKGKPRGSKAIAIDDKMVHEVKTLAGFGLTIEQIADVLGITGSTLCRYKKEHTELEQAWRTGKMRAMAEVARTAFDIAINDRNPAMCMFLLKTQLRWCEVDRVEHDVTVGVKEAQLNLQKQIVEIRKEKGLPEP